MHPAAEDSLIRILIEPGDYVLRNAGDTAMLQTAVVRLRRMWPKASIRILADEANVGPALCHNARPLGVQGRRIWFGPFLFSSHLPGSIASGVHGLEKYLRRHYPSLVESVLRVRLGRHGPGGQELDDFLEAISSADLVIVSGMGGITDAFPNYAEHLLDTLELALYHHRLTALMGQGIGPLRNPRLRARAKAVLPRLDFIALREDLAGGPLLRSLGVDRRRTMTTGDDAIEMAYQARSQTLGSGIGVNLRAASYAGVDQSLAERVGRVLRTAAMRYAAKMVALPISWVPGEEDSETIRTLIAEKIGRAGTRLHIGSLPVVLQQVRLCRIVVTGSYHAAVFALSQGISAVGVANTQYYLDKFSGLSRQFGGNCEVVHLADAEIATHLRAAIERAWTSAEERRPTLLAAARRQIELSHAAYQRVFEMVVSRKQREYDAENT
jgi:polysaccharide pyruvyl transferase WcaK-like protein